MRRYQQPRTETKPRRYHVVHTTAQEACQWATEDAERALQALEVAAKKGPLSPPQLAQLARLKGLDPRG